MRKLIRLQKWRRRPISKGSTKNLAIFEAREDHIMYVLDASSTYILVVQLEPVIKRYNYHYLYTWSDFLADLGGYLGLFLGVSVFSVVTVLERTLRRKNRKKGEAVVVAMVEMETERPIVRRRNVPTRQFCKHVYVD